MTPAAVLALLTLFVTVSVPAATRPDRPPEAAHGPLATPCPYDDGLVALCHGDKRVSEELFNKINVAPTPYAIARKKNKKWVVVDLRAGQVTSPEYFYILKMTAIGGKSHQALVQGDPERSALLWLAYTTCTTSPPRFDRAQGCYTRTYLDEQMLGAALMIAMLLAITLLISKQARTLLLSPFSWRAMKAWNAVVRPLKHKYSYKNTGVAIDPENERVHLWHRSHFRTYPFSEIREWRYCLQTGGAVYGGGAVAVGATLRAGRENRTATGFFVSARDIDHPEWQVRFPPNGRSVLKMKRWMEIFNQFVNRS